MASTKFHVGLSDEQACAKKPTNFRGRTHTDIFGTSEPVQPTPNKNAPESNMKNLLMEAEGAEGKEKEETDDGKTQKENKAENGNSAEAQTPQRVRMPPGGFSSKLW